MSKKVNDAIGVNTPDTFDPENLRLDQNFDETVGVAKLITTIPVKKPAPQDFVRVHPDCRLPVGLIELKDDREVYVVHPSIAALVADEMYRAMIFLAINRQGVIFLWPVKLPSPDGRQSDWHRSAMEAAEAGMGRWVRVKANTSLGAYEISVATAAIPDPEWPEMSLQEMLSIAFKNRIIDSIDHPVLKRLRGE